MFRRHMIFLIAECDPGSSRKMSQARLPFRFTLRLRLFSLLAFVSTSITVDTNARIVICISTVTPSPELLRTLLENQAIKFVICAQGTATAQPLPNLLPTQS